MLELLIGFVIGVVVGALFYRRHSARLEVAAQKVKDVVSK